MESGQTGGHGQSVVRVISRLENVNVSMARQEKEIAKDQQMIP